MGMVDSALTGLRQMIENDKVAVRLIRAHRPDLRRRQSFQVRRNREVAGGASVARRRLRTAPTEGIR